MEFMIDENLLEIFSNLDAESLVKASLVCRRWEALISNSMYLMRNFDLIISAQSNNFTKHQVLQNGKYQNLSITFNGFVFMIPEDVMDYIRSKNEHLKSITLKYVDRLRLIQVTFNLPNITKLSITDYKNQSKLTELIDMPNLKHLELNNSILVADVIGRNSIEILKIFGTKIRDEQIRNDFTSELNTLLQNCSSLKDLTLSNIQFKNPHLNFANFKFNLTALTIEKFNFNEENLVEFLVQQKDSLKKLSILHDKSQQILPLVIFQQLCLDELEIDVSLIPTSYQPDVMNSTIKKLTIRSANCSAITHRISDVQRRILQINRQNINVNGLRRILAIGRPNNQVQFMDQLRLLDQNQRRRPNRQQVDPTDHLKADKVILACRAIEKIMIIDITSDSLLQQISSTQTDVKILKLQKIPQIISPTIYFDKLECLEVDKIESVRDLENCKFLIIYSPNLKILKINSIPTKLFEQKFFISIINKAQNLRKIHIGTRCQFTSDMIDAVKKLKFRGRPLNVLSFEHCCVIEADKAEFKDIFMEDLKLNFHSNSTKFFAPMINETQLGQMKRKIEEKGSDLEQQVKWSIERSKALQNYENCENDN